MVNVEIYIKIPIDDVTSTESLTADLTTYTADSSSITADATSITTTTGGYVYKRLDLFKDEKISLTSSIQNINDLSKVFTDYSQSFTVPASKNNNQIFNYWNESGVNDGFDQRIRYDAIIEINTIPFKKGQIQIEKANEKDNRIESFSITFYGKVKQLKDLFKDDKLSNLDYAGLNHNYGLTEVKNRITGTTDDGVYYPLIGNQHKYEYLTGGPNDISVGGSTDKSIVYTDLFPAISLTNIFSLIGAYYGITFTSSLFNTSYWNDLYLYCKNIEKSDPYTFVSRVNFTTTTQPRNISVTNDTYTIDWVINDGVTNCNSQSSTLVIYPSSITIPYRVKIYTSAGLYAVYDNLIGNAGIGLFTYLQNHFINYTFWFEVESTASFSYTSHLEEIKYYGSLFTTWDQQINTADGTNSSSTQIIKLNTLVPEMKISDFFTGIIKIFNLTVTAVSDTEFNLEPLEFYYAYGDYLDINSYVINDSVDLERTKLFKKITFNHEKSENILNNYFRNTFNRGYDYGDLIFEDNLSNESNTYEIKTPFEDVMWDRKPITANFITATLIDKDLKPYKPKPILMYKNGLQNLATNIYITDGTTYNTVGVYQRFSNELFLNNSIASLNFNSEQSSWDTNALASDSLFNLWYNDYISGLYDIRCRIVKLKAIMPITQLSTIKLNDKIVYKDKKYIINQFTTDLTSGEVDFELVSDFRAVTNSAGGTDRFALKQTFVIDNTAQDLEVTILKLNSEKYDVQYDPTAFSARDNIIDDTFIVPIDSNVTGSTAFKQIEITYYNPDVTQYINIIQNA